jgi:hypothetical protein
MEANNIEIENIIELNQIINEENIIINNENNIRIDRNKKKCII